MQKLETLIDSYYDDMVKDIQRLVKIKSVRDEPKGNMPFGEGVQKVLEEALAMSKELGFETTNIDNYAGVASYGDGEEDIAIIAHLDVVPEGDGWTHPPYSATYKDGVIYGRGVSDNKGPAIIGLYAIKALIESGVDINKKLKVIFGTNEESGMVDLKYYAKNVGTPSLSLVPDASFPVVKGEKGIMSFKFQSLMENKELTSKVRVKSGFGGNAVNSVPDYAELVLDVDDLDSFKSYIESYNSTSEDKVELIEDDTTIKLIARGVSAHGSRPETGKNANSILFKSLSDLIKESETILSTFVKLYLDKIAFYHHGEKIGCEFEDEESGKLAFNPGLMSILENAIEVAVNIRFPVTYSAKQVYQGMQKTIEGLPVTIIEGSDSSPYYHDDDNTVIKQLMSIYQDYSKDYDSKPLVMGGGTYSRVISNSYTFGPGFPWSKSNAHQPDEQASMKDIILATKIYAQTLYKLTR